MKPIFIYISILITTLAYSQDETKTSGFYFKISLATTLTINEEFTIGNNDDETFINPSAVFINSTIGLQVNEKFSVGFNIEYDWHSKQGLNFLPIYVTTKYNLIEDEENIFVRGGYGMIINPNSHFEKGTFYKAGLGIQIFDDAYKNSWLIGLDFCRKRFGFKQDEKISSVSIFVEFMLF